MWSTLTENEQARNGEGNFFSLVGEGDFVQICNNPYGKGRCGPPRRFYWFLPKDFHKRPHKPHVGRSREKILPLRAVPFWTRENRRNGWSAWCVLPILRASYNLYLQQSIFMLLLSCWNFSHACNVLFCESVEHRSCMTVTCMSICECHFAWQS